MTLADLFPDADYQFRLRFERAPAGEFFRPTPGHERLVAERRHWLETGPARYAALQPEGVPLLDETIAFARKEGLLWPTDVSEGPDQAWIRCWTLGKTWESDFLLLAIEADGTMRLRGGCVCFPSSWSLEEKIGHPIEVIHGIVPGLNAAIGPQIHAFLSKLRPGIAWFRSNWGLSRSGELNLHPARRMPRLDDTIEVEDVWLRVEHQALVALPQTRGILFGIRLELYPLSEIRANDTISPRLTRALATMPEDMARYKGLSTAREKLLRLLKG